MGKEKTRRLRDLRMGFRFDYDRPHPEERAQRMSRRMDVETASGRSGHSLRKYGGRPSAAV